MSQARHAGSPIASSGLRAASWLPVTALLLVASVFAGCGSTAATPAAPTASPALASAAVTEAPADPVETAGTATSAERPEWFDLEMIDVLTDEPFTINDFAGQVVLLETMAVWCPTCRKQGDEVARLHELLDHPADLVSVSLDVDLGEDAALLRNYAQKLGYDWRIAVAPLLVARALGNEYSAQYLNPPVAPMLVIDREGNVLGLPFGGVKSAESLQGVVEPLLDA